jgi:small-conductance mechanosensitive channel
MIVFHSAPTRRSSLVFLAFLLGLIGLAPLAEASDRHTWTGTWETRWRNGGANLFLEQSGTSVTGTFPFHEGTIEGRAIKPTALEGRWFDVNGQGTFSFTMAADGQSFLGRFGTGEWWTGVKISTETTHTVFNASTPAQLFFAFLDLGNQTRESRPERFYPLLSNFCFQNFDPQPQRISQQLAAIERFFLVLDQLTFRLYDIQPPSDGQSTMTITLRQAGTNVTYPVQLTSIAEFPRPIEWQFVLPPPEDIETSLSILLEPRKGELPFPDEHHELTSARDTMRTFLEQFRNAQRGDAQLFLRTLNLSQIAPAAQFEDGLLRGQYLKEIIDRVGYVIWQEIPNNPNRRAPYDHFVHPVGIIQIEPVETDDGKRIWQFSSRTLASARDLYIAMEDLPVAAGIVLGETTPFFRVRNAIRQYDRRLLKDFAGMERWQWLAVIGLFGISIPASWLITTAIIRLVRLRRSTESERMFKLGFIWPVRFLMVSLLGLVSLRVLGLPQIYDTPLRLVLSLITSIAGGWLAYNTIDRVSYFYSRNAERFLYHDEILQSLITSFLKVAVVLGSILLLANLLNLPYQGVIAGLGIGGVAVALAVRGTLENFIGGLTLYADKPIRVGDFCRFGDKVGTVENIGLRSVRVRGVDRILVTIPNAEFVNLYIENFTRRDKILLRTTLQVRYETTPDQLRLVLVELRKLLIQHPRVQPEPCRARFIGFGAHSLDIEIFCYINTSAHDEFLAIQEDLFLRIIALIDQSGTGFAFPSVVNYIGRDPGTNAERTARAEAIIQELREKSDLPFPDYPDYQRQLLSDKLDYPPLGSSSRL